MLATLTGRILHRSEPQVTHRCGGDKNSPGSRPAVRIKRGAIHPGTVLAQQEALLSRQFKHLAALTQPSPPAGEVRRDPRRLHSQRHRPRRFPAAPAVGVAPLPRMHRRSVPRAAVGGPAPACLSHRAGSHCGGPYRTTVSILPEQHAHVDTAPPVQIHNTLLSAHR